MTSKSQARPVWNRMGAILVSALLLAACGLADPVQNYPRKEGDRAIPNPTGERDTVFGPGGLSLFGDDKPEGTGGGGSGSGIGINSFLWRASLDTLSFMPLNSADPFGGVIITDWFTLEEEPGSQYRVTAYILGRQLRTDNIKIALYVRPKGTGKAKMDPHRASAVAEAKLENVILSKARTIRATQFK